MIFLTVLESAINLVDYEMATVERVRTIRIYSYSNPLILFINFVFFLLYLLLLVRIILRLLGASTAAPFVEWIYNTSTNAIAPFSGIFSSISLGANNVIDIPALVALLVFIILNFLVVEGVNMLLGEEN